MSDAAPNASDEANNAICPSKISQIYVSWDGNKLGNNSKKTYENRDLRVLRKRVHDKIRDIPQAATEEGGPDNPNSAARRPGTEHRPPVDRTETDGAGATENANGAERTAGGTGPPPAAGRKNPRKEQKARRESGPPPLAIPETKSPPPKRRRQIRPPGACGATRVAPQRTSDRREAFIQPEESGASSNYPQHVAPGK